MFAIRPLIVSFAVTVLLTPAMKVLAIRTGVVARPAADRWHRSIIPLLGGIAVSAGTLLGLVIAARPFPVAILFAMFIAAAMAVVGLVDDVIGMKPVTKLLLQVAAGSATVAFGLTGGWTASPTINALLTIFWFVGITNAFNLLDNMDGLCAGIAGIAAVASALALGSGAPTAFAAALAGACLAFLIFNFNPASIFLGDAGSLFIGSSLALLTLMGTRDASAGLMSTIAAPVLVLLIPIFDTTLVTVLRKLSARSASIGGKDHTSHRLVAIGFSERQTALMMYGMAAVAGGTAVATRYTGGEGVALAAMVAIAVVLLGIYLANVRVYGEQDLVLLRDRPYTPLLVTFTYKRRVFEVLLDVGLIAIAYYSAYVLRFDQDRALHYKLFLESLPIIVPVQLASLLAIGVYQGVWRHVSLADVSRLVKGVVIGTVATVLVLVYLYHFRGYSRAVFIIYALVFGALLVGTRGSFRLIADAAGRRRTAATSVLIYGAGDGGVLLLRELRNNPRYGYRVLGFIDDDPAAAGRRILGAPVLSDGDHAEPLLDRLQPAVLIFSSEKIRPERRLRVADACRARGITVMYFRFMLEPEPLHLAERR